MKIKYLVLLTLFFSFSSVKAQYHLDQLSDSLRVYLEEGWKCWNETEEGSCIPYYQKFFEAVKESGECLPCAETELARIYAWEGYYEKSIEHSQNVLQEAKKIEGRLRYELESDAYNEIGNNYKELGNLEKALEYQLKSLKVKDEIEKYDKITAAEYKAINKFNIGGIYSVMNDCKRAIEYQKQTFVELTALRNNRTCQVADGISGEYFNCSQLDSAKVWAFRTIKLAKTQKIGNQFEISAYTRLAEVYKEQQPDSALYYIDKAQKFDAENSLVLENARMYITKGNILSEQGKYTEAKKSFIEAQKRLQPLHAVQDLVILYKHWGIAAHDYHDYETASQNLLQFIRLNDSINSENTQKIVRELNTKYETEKKERQIAQQQLDIQKQKGKTQTTIFIGITLLILVLAVLILIRRNHKAKLKQIQQEKENAILNSFIQGEERERNRISYELHDGVASMISAAKMTLDSIPHLSVEKQKEQMEKVSSILSDTHSDVRHIAHNLLPTTLEKEKLIKATQQFVSEINQSNLVEITVIDKNSNAHQFPQQIQLMLFRIIQELVNNIVKHSQAQHATIEFSQTQNGLQLEITDDGIGYSGDNNENSQGIYSIRQRLKSIGGHFEIVKKSSQGTQAIVELSINQHSL